MVDRHDNQPNSPIDPSLMDTQRLLLGVDPAAGELFDLEDILAEYSGRSEPTESPEPPADAPPQEDAAPPKPEERQDEPLPEAHAAPEEPAPSLLRRLFRRRAPAKGETPPAGEVPEEAERQEVPANPLPPEAAAPAPPEAPPVPVPPPPEPEEEDESLEDDGNLEELLDMVFWEGLGVTEAGLAGSAPPPEATAPAVSETQSAPEIPQPPGSPAVPAVQEVQKTPETPKAPAAPAAREVPKTPETPAAPAVPAAREVPKTPEAGEEEPPASPPAVSMEDVVANTVDAVKEAQEKRQERLRRRLEKSRKERAVKRREPQHTLPEIQREPPAGETANRHRRRLRECRRSLRLAVPVVAGLWLPWVLERFGIKTPFFSDSAENAALCVLVAQAMTSILCWPVYRAAVEGFKDRAWTIYATALLSTLVTLLDEMTLLLLPERCDASPLGGIAAALTLFAQWGLTSYHRGMSESFRTAAMGEPSRVADRCEQGVAKGAGGVAGFYTRCSMEDTASQWQRLLLPVLAAASVVFAVLSSVGRERSQDFLWCWSVVLCAGSSLAFPLAYLVPFGRAALRLARAGAAMAGHYGAARLSSSRRLVVTDTDLFPPGAAVLAGLKLYGEEKNRALSYAATLAVQGGGVLGRVFADVCRSSRVEYQGLEHFHIHEDGGLSGMIRGETVLVGTAAFMRRKAVRLPPRLPSKTPVCLAVDGTLTAVFAVKYTAADTVDLALRAMRRNGLQLTLAVRDASVTSKLLRARFGSDCGAVRPELGERLSLSDPEREAEGPSGLLYREGLLPFVTLAVASRRLCQTAAVGNLLSLFSSITGTLLGFYLTFTGSYQVLTPVLLMTYLLLWVAPMLPLVWTADKL